MRTAVLSDVHGNLQALKAVLQDCERQKVDNFWLLGDYVDYGGNSIETVKELAALKAEYMIAGNHDACLYIPAVRSSSTPHGRLAYEYTRELVAGNRKSFEMLESIVHKPLLYLEHRRTLLVHGTPEDPYWGKFLPGENADSLYAVMEQLGADTMFMGHSHVSFMLTKGGRRIINPGSVGQPRNGCPGAAYAIAGGDGITFRQVEYDIDGAAEAIRRAGLPDYLWRRLYKGI
ncbi:MAG: metallophosphoesterase family protein [Clostridium sp.]|nr:metallophosphoesterase family protein [Clostridium sp.]